MGKWYQGLKELGPVLLLWAKMWLQRAGRWVVYSPRHLWITVGVIVACLVIVNDVRGGSEPVATAEESSTEAVSATSTDVDGVVYSTITAKPLSGQGATAESGAAAGPLDAAGSAAAERVTREFFSAYLTRQREGDAAWQSNIAALVTTQLASELEADLAGVKQYPVSVIQVRLLPVDENLPVDTATRFSRNVEVSVQTGAQERSMTYTVSVTNLGETSGWRVSKAVAK
ncbi:MAG: hypothetical protein LBE25_09355 [Arthrobacter sp.]|jgi:hypothetical protein|nr:hypothetical protein [Arthrobacter sp.]